MRHASIASRRWSRRRRHAARSHRRLVAPSRRLHFAADGDHIQRAAAALAAAAIAEVDLTTHAGVHPRIGALDVLPFVPLGSASMDDAVAIAHAVGRAIGETLRLRCFSTKPRRARRIGGRSKRCARRLDGLAAVYGSRRGSPTTARPRAPDGRRDGGRRTRCAGGLEPRPRSARRRWPGTSRARRTSGGGLPCLKALGLALEHSGKVQVSLNLTDYRTTSMADVYRAVDAEARRAGATIADSEIIGLVPRAALDDFARWPSISRRVIKRRCWKIGSRCAAFHHSARPRPARERRSASVAVRPDTGRS